MNEHQPIAVTDVNHAIGGRNSSEVKIKKEIATYCRASELGGLDLLDAQYEKQNFSRHSHEGYTVGVIETGAQRFFRTGGNHIAPQNSIILVNADEVHNGHSASEGGWSYKAMYPRPEQFESLKNELDFQFTGAPYFSEPVVYDPYLATQLRLVFHTLQHSDSKLLRETLVFDTLTKLMCRHGKAKPQLTSLSTSKRQLLLVKEFLDDFPEENVSLDELGKLANLSPYYLVRAFQKQFGLPPHAYQIQAKLRKAKSLLYLGSKISDIAQDLGFHDQSHFHRHFKRAMGVTPGQYLKGL